MPYLVVATFNFGVAQKVTANRNAKRKVLKLRSSVPEARHVIAWGANPRLLENRTPFPHDSIGREAADRVVGENPIESACLGFAPQAIT